MSYKAVFFDLGGTLIEYENHDWATLGKMGLAAVHPFLKNLYPQLPQPDLFAQTFYRHLRELLDQREIHAEISLYDAVDIILRKMSLDVSDGLAHQFVDIYYKPVTEQISVIAGANELLQTLKRAGLKIGLISNTIFPEKFHLQELADFGLRKYFDFTIFSSSVGMRKPAGGIFKMALGLAGGSPAETIFIGDRFDADIAGAKNAGIAAVWIFHENRDNPDGVTPDFEVEKLSELTSIVLT